MSESDSQSLAGAVAGWFVRRWEDISGAKREEIKQQGEAIRIHLETKRSLLKGRSDHEVPPEYLDKEIRETSEELRKTYGR
jgi:hypothetical protein